MLGAGLPLSLSLSRSAPAQRTTKDCRLAAVPGVQKVRHGIECPKSRVPGERQSISVSIGIAVGNSCCTTCDAERLQKFAYLRIVE